MVQFHPSYSYEDFIRGIEVSTSEGRPIYETVNKVMGGMSKLAKDHPKITFVLIVDEINRANLSSVFGELIYALEYRGEAVQTPYRVDGSSKLEVPSNLYIIGTMNTADKSVGSIDYAIRRRFLFFDRLPERETILNYGADNDVQRAINERSARLFDSVSLLFSEDHLNPEYRKEDVQIGHTYFLVKNDEMLFNRLIYQILPILKEYHRDGVIVLGNANDSRSKILSDCILGKKSLSAPSDPYFQKLVE